MHHGTCVGTANPPSRYILVLTKIIYKQHKPTTIWDIVIEIFTHTSITDNCTKFAKFSRSNLFFIQGSISFYVRDNCLPSQHTRLHLSNATWSVAILKLFNSYFHLYFRWQLDIWRGVDKKIARSNCLQFWTYLAGKLGIHVSFNSKTNITCFNYIDTLRQSDAYMRYQPRPSLGEIMDCRLFCPSHYLNQCYIIVNWNNRSKLQWNFNRHSYVFIH